ncbi:MAG: S26 family signal peptidase, partial [bacterium]
MGQILSALENQWVVFILALIVLVIRLLYAAYRRKNPLPPVMLKEDILPKKRKDFMLEVIDTVLIALILVFGIVRPYFLQTFFIPSGSMESTLMGPREENGRKLGGDRLIGNRFIYRFRAPEREEIVIFQPPMQAVIGSTQSMVDGLPGLPFRKPAPIPAFMLRRWITENPGKIKTLNPNWNDDAMLGSLPEFPARPDDYIKRVIGVPGDRIRIVEGKGVFLNGST